MLLSEGVQGRQVQWAATGPRNAFERSGLPEQEEGLTCSRKREGLGQGEGTQPGWGPPGVRVEVPMRQTRQACISGHGVAERNTGCAGELSGLSHLRGQWVSETWGWRKGSAGEQDVGDNV